MAIKEAFTEVEGAFDDFQLFDTVDDAIKDIKVEINVNTEEKEENK